MGILGAKGDDDAGEGEIDSCGEERRGDSQTHDLHQEGILVTSVSNGLENDRVKQRVEQKKKADPART